MIKLTYMSIVTVFGVMFTQIHSAMFLGAAAVLINGIMVSGPPVFIYCLIKYPEFAGWIKSLIEDGDNVPNKADAKDAVILFFAYMVGWGLIDIILYSALYDKELNWLIGISSALFVALLGISQFSHLGKK